MTVAVLKDPSMSAFLPCDFAESRVSWTSVASLRMDSHSAHASWARSIAQTSKFFHEGKVKFNLAAIANKKADFDA